MRIHQGKVGGPDCSNATETNQVFVRDAAGTMKCECEGKPGETKLLKVSAEHAPGHFKTIGLTQDSISDATWGWCGADGKLDAAAPKAGAGHGQQQVQCYDPSVKKNKDLNPPRFPEFGPNAVTHVLLSIGQDGKPTVYRMGLGLPV